MYRNLVAACLVAGIACCVAQAAPTITGITAADSCGMYDRYEISFSVSTTASNPYWPYDSSPAANTETHPNAVPAGVGVSVDGLFSGDNWQTTVVQPGFYCQPYTTDPAIGSAWTYPSGPPVWKIRFAPTSAGVWRYRIRVTDASGTIISEESSFNCTASANHGFVRVSPSDGRYFQLSDGTFLPMIGLADPGVEHYSKLSNMGVNLVRSWWQSSNPKLALFGAGGQGGDQNIKHLNYTTDFVRPNHLVSSKIPNLGSSWTSAWNGINTSVSTRKNTDYRFTCMVKTVGLTGTGDYGLFVGVHPLLLKSSRLTGDNDWRELTLTFNSADMTEVILYVAEMNVTAGTAYLSDWSFKEVLGNGQYGPEMLPRPDLQSHTNYDQRIAAEIDKLLDSARQNKIYVRAVIEEKGDSFLRCIQANGTWGTGDDANLYAASTHACRTYQEYYWRYLIARYGYSTAIHSVELFNEADPFDSRHYDAAAALGAYFRINDPNKHLASTSNWHSFPPLMWQQPDLGIADLHMYLGWKIASGGNRIWPGWDGNWTTANGSTDAGLLFAVDTTVAHTGRRSMKITVPSSPNDDGGKYKLSDVWFTVAAPATHTVRFSLWAKGSNLVTYNKNWMKPGGIALQYSEGGGDFAGYPTGTGTTSAPWGTYDWQPLEFTVTVPTEPQSGAETRRPMMFWVQIYARANNSATPGTIWIDDLLIEDLTTDQILNYNGGFEEWEPESYDVVAAHCSYSRLAGSYQLNKPVIRGETALCYTQRFGSSYKGFTYQGTAVQPGEDQLLVDDAAGVWWRKWVWSHTDFGGLTEVYWWPTVPLARNHLYGRAYLNFMQGMPVANGHYRDIRARVSNPALRVLGQKDLTNNRAYLWIDNAPYTWKAVADNAFRPEAWNSSLTYAKDSVCGAGNPLRVYKSLQANNTNRTVGSTSWWKDNGLFNAANNPPLPPAASGTVTVYGLKDGGYKVEWWNTSTGSFTTEERTCTDGNLELPVQNLQSDIACKVYPVEARIEITMSAPSSQVVPGETVTVTVRYSNTGETQARMVNVPVPVPAGMTYVAGSAEATGGAFDAATGTVSWVVPVVGAHESGTRTFQATVH